MKLVRQRLLTLAGDAEPAADPDADATDELSTGLKLLCEVCLLETGGWQISLRPVPVHCIHPRLCRG